jgi:putative transposase
VGSSRARFTICSLTWSAAEKLEIIRLVEQSHLPVRRTLKKLGVPRATFYQGV